MTERETYGLRFNSAWNNIAVMDVDGIKWKRTIFTHGLEITVYCRRYNIISRNLTASVRSSCYIHRRFLKRIAMMVSRWNILYLLSFLIITFLAFFVTNYLMAANIHFANLFREAHMSYHFLWYRKTYIPCVNIGNDVALLYWKIEQHVL